MTVPKSILIISRDRVLQQTRKLILEHSGYHVSDVHSDEEAIKAVESSIPYMLVLLCHTVPERSRLFLVGRIRELQPKLPILMLYNSYDLTQAKVDGSLHSLDSPTELLDMIVFLTGKARSVKAS
jgi:DNA-binding response OmpR family regulator